MVTITISVMTAIEVEAMVSQTVSVAVVAVAMMRTVEVVAMVAVTDQVTGDGAAQKSKKSE